MQVLACVLLHHQACIVVQATAQIQHSDVQLGQVLPAPDVDVVGLDVHMSITLLMQGLHSLQHQHNITMDPVQEPYLSVQQAAAVAGTTLKRVGVGARVVEEALAGKK